jgi:glycosyltransferase involved in cell wall biosynthesis
VDAGQAVLNRAERPRATSAARRPHIVFVNSGILGHRAVAALIKDSAGAMSIEATHINLSEDLTIGDRVVRRLLCARVAPATGPAANLDLARWRQQMNVALLAARRIAAVDRRAPIDLLHVHTQAAAWASLRRMSRIPTIISIDATERQASLEMTSPLARWTYGPNVRRDGRVFGAARAIVATSRWAAADLATLYPECAAKVRVMPYPVRTAHFDPSWLDARARSGEAGPVRFLFMGGDFPRKGGPLLLDAWREAAFGDRAELDIVTDWRLDANQLPGGARVVRDVTPYSPQWSDLWRRADVFVMPTRGEAFGMVFQEAAAAGVPAIATSINAIPEIVQDGTTGVLVRPGDRADLVHAMAMLVGSPELRARLGRAARDRILAIASPESYAANLNTLIDDVLERHVHVS